MVRKRGRERPTALVAIAVINGHLNPGPSFDYTRIRGNNGREGGKEGPEGEGADSTGFSLSYAVSSTWEISQPAGFFLSPPSLIMPHNLSVCPPSRAGAGGRLARKLAARLLFARVASSVAVAVVKIGEKCRSGKNKRASWRGGDGTEIAAKTPARHPRMSRDRTYDQVSNFASAML